MNPDPVWTRPAMRAVNRSMDALDSDHDIRALQLLREAASLVAQAIQALEKQIETRIAETPLEKPQ